ncbi:Branched-chain amino acid transport system / permease component [Candidatus Burarchaeum australiense]|nr:Branched-chain amino acid transport system / permease component [Candidatus Burarchaeum australiense]
MLFPPQVLANGLVIGCIYSLVAAGYALVYSTARFIHIAHGATVVAGGFAAYYFMNTAGFGFFPAAAMALTLCMALGALMELLYYAPLRKRKATATMMFIGSTGLFLLLINALILFFGGEGRMIMLPFGNPSFELLGAIFTLWQLVIIAATIALMLLLMYFIRRSDWGLMLRAVADQPALCAVNGIDVERIHLMVILISSLLAGVAGIMIGAEQSMRPESGIDLVLAGFTGAIMGGIGTIAGAALGAILLGMVQNMGAWFLPSTFKYAIGMTILAAFLVFRPQGIFGAKKEGSRA